MKHSVAKSLNSYFFNYLRIKNKIKWNEIFFCEDGLPPPPLLMKDTRCCIEDLIRVIRE